MCNTIDIMRLLHDCRYTTSNPFDSLYKLDFICRRAKGNVDMHWVFHGLHDAWTNHIMADSGLSVRSIQGKGCRSVVGVMLHKAKVLKVMVNEKCHILSQTMSRSPCGNLPTTIPRSEPTSERQRMLVPAWLGELAGRIRLWPTWISLRIHPGPPLLITQTLTSYWILLILFMAHIHSESYTPGCGVQCG